MIEAITYEEYLSLYSYYLLASGSKMMPAIKNTVGDLLALWQMRGQGRDWETVGKGEFLKVIKQILYEELTVDYTDLFLHLRDDDAIRAALGWEVNTDRTNVNRDRDTISL